MSAPPADLLLPPRRVERALGMPHATYANMRARGQLDALFGPPEANGYSRFTLVGALALAGYRAFTDLRIEPPKELPPSAFMSIAVDWLRTRGMTRPVREAVFRWYGRPGDQRFSRAYNEDVLTKQPDAGARITIRLDLDVIFGEALQALLAEPVSGRMPEETLGLSGDE